MTLKEFARLIHTEEKIVIIEEKGCDLVETAYFTGDCELFTDSLNNAIWPTSFYERPVCWFARREEDGVGYYRVRIGK